MSSPLGTELALEWVVLRRGGSIRSLAIILSCSLAAGVAATSSASATLRDELGPTSGGPGDMVVYIEPAVRLARAEKIRDTAALSGMYNAVLLAGIGQVETGFAHCWSEATWACQGPSSSSCAGGPVIAGASDGPCSSQQGGLGLFQFDSGTFTDTINTYGTDIVTLEGNVNAVVPFLVTRAIQSIDGVNTEEEALAWMNSIPVLAGDPLFEEWIYFVAWRYNGCKGCSATQGKYRDATLLLLDEMGAEFWMTSADDPCSSIPQAGAIIEENDDCYRASGPAQYWRIEDAGHGGRLEWTKTTSNEAASNYATWRLRFEQAGDYDLEVYTDGGSFGMSKAAAYEVTHAGGTDTILVDQSAQSGWIMLGRFSFSTEDGNQVRLADNTGEAFVEEPDGTKIMFDALRVSGVDGSTSTDPNDPNGDSTSGGSSGSCSISNRGAAGFWPLLLMLFALRRRRSQ